MVSSISLSGLSCIKPDGKPLFTNIDFCFTCERIGLVGRNGVGKTTLLHVIAGDMMPYAGRVAVSGRVALMRQDGMTRPDATLADLFGLREALALLDRAAGGQASVDELAEADWMAGARMEAELVLWNSWLLMQKGAAAQHRKLRGSGGGGVVRSLVLQDRGRV